MKKISTILIIGLLMSLTSCMSDAIKEVEKEKDKDDAIVDKGHLRLTVPSSLKYNGKGEISVELYYDKNVTTPVDVTVKIIDENVVHFTGDTTCKLTSATKSCHLAIQAGTGSIRDMLSTTVRASATNYEDQSGTISLMSMAAQD